jgi:hypothetical protein
MNKLQADFIRTIRVGVVAGAAGGLAEIAWVSLYAQATGANAASIARGVTTAAGIIAAVPNESVPAGIVIHMVLATGLGVALALAWRALSPRLGAAGNPYAPALAALAAVWAINFLVVLPALGSNFVTLMPYAASLASKLLFGVAAAEVLRRECAPLRTLQPAVVRSAR